MMNQPKPFASLSSGLLARKGQARPAMRPQGFLQMGNAAPQEDLGWNDMGADAAPPEAHAESARPVAAAPDAGPRGEASLLTIKPIVLQQREAVAERLNTVAPKPVPAPEPAPAKAPVPDAAMVRVARAVAAKKAKAAFTLRLDPPRHLRLRLASAVTCRSAQQIVVEALDRFLASLDEVEALARQLDPAKDHG